jgi:hypothetical protein
MSLNIPGIANKLNELAPPHHVGKLQDIRKQLKKLKRRPGDKRGWDRGHSEFYCGDPSN